MDELIALVGRNWRLLLLYPGGLTAFGCVEAARLLLEEPLRLGRDATPRRGSEIVVAAIWLLVIALLPLPQTGWPYALDLVILLLLLEIPYLIQIFHSPNRTAALTADQLVPLLNVYPLLALSIATLGQGAGSLVVLEINRSSGLLHWAGIVGWASVLPPLLSLGPWKSQRLSGTLPTIRQTAHFGLLLSATLPANDETPIAAALIGFACIILPLAALNRWWRGSGEWWLGWQPWLVAVLTLLIAWTSGQSLLQLR